MRYKYLTEQEETELIEVLCSDYDLKSILKHIEDLVNDNYGWGYDKGWKDGYAYRIKEVDHK